MCLDTFSYLLGKKKGGGGTPTLQTKSVTITENGSSSVTPDTGYDGLSQVNITANVSGGGDVNITDLDVLNTEVNKLGKKFIDYLGSIIDDYEPYTSEALTIYTPDATCKHFFIGKRNNQYRIIWGADDFCPYIFQSEVSQGFTNALLSYGTDNAYKANFDDIVASVYIATGRSGFKTMYSNYFNTVEDLITALKDNTGANITYTSSTSYSSYGGTIDSTWTTVITNIPIFQMNAITGDREVFLEGKVLSKKLTIDVIS